MLILFALVIALAGATDPLLEELCTLTPHIRSRAQNWCSETEDQCDWEGVTCFKGKAIALRLENIPIEFTLPFVSLGSSDIEQVHLRGCGIRGQLDSITANAGLTLLDLSNNDVTGFVSDDLLKNRLTLRLSNVNIEGTVSQHICGKDVSALEELDLSDNEITDDLSACIGTSFPHLRSLRLQGNHFDGRAFFPANAAIYNISGNAFTSLEADVTPGFGGTTIDLPKKPKTTIEYPYLILCDMSGNAFTGEMPQWLKLSRGKNLNVTAKCKYTMVQEN